MLLHRKHVLAVLFAVALVAVAVIALSRQGTARAQIGDLETGTILFQWTEGGRLVLVEFKSCEGLGNVMAVNENQGKLVQQPIQVVCKRTGVPLRLLWEKRQQAVTGEPRATFNLIILLTDASTGRTQMTYQLTSVRVSGLTDTATVGATVATTATFTAAKIEGALSAVPVNP